MYFHWITDALPRLVAVEGLGVDFPVLLPESYKSIFFVEESLNLLGYDFVYFSDNKRNYIKELILPSQTASPGNYNALLINKLRSKLIQKYTTPFRKVFVSRNKAKQRFLSNENEVIGVLQEGNMTTYSVVDTATMSYYEQLKLIRSTNVLIGIHGAGLMFIMFAADEAVLVEIHPSYRQDRHFRHAARVTGKVCRFVSLFRFLQTERLYTSEFTFMIAIYALARPAAGDVSRII